MIAITKIAMYFDFISLPFSIFLITYLDFLSRLKSYAIVLHEEISNGYLRQTTLQKCYEFKTIISQTQTLFSGYIFYSESCGLLIIIALIFRAISMFIIIRPSDRWSVSAEEVIFSTGYLLFNVSFAIFISWMNLASDDFKDEIACLSNETQTTLLHKADEKIMINGKWTEITLLKENIVKSFDNFCGFSGYNFFTLGRSHLTGVIANAVTYLIVLVQFKYSES